jgi:hypothetical protein
MVKPRLSVAPRSLCEHTRSIPPARAEWTFAPIPRTLAPPVTRPWGRTPVRAVVDGVSWDTSIWRDTKTNGALLAVPARIRGRKRAGDAVTVELTFNPKEETDTV